MRDTDKRQPFEDTAEPVSTTDPRSTVEPTSATRTESIPVDETGLERGGPVPDAPVLDQPVTDRTRTDDTVLDDPRTDDSVADRPFADEPPVGEPFVDESFVDEPVTDASKDGRAADRQANGTAPTDEPMFADDVAEQLRTRWRELQADFVDDPERAVRTADEVIDEMMKTITERRQRLTGDWQGQSDTEELRQALRGYRSFFDTLLPH